MRSRQFFHISDFLLKVPLSVRSGFNVRNPSQHCPSTVLVKIHNSMYNYMLTICTMPCHLKPCAGVFTLELHMDTYTVFLQSHTQNNFCASSEMLNRCAPLARLFGRFRELRCAILPEFPPKKCENMNSYVLNRMFFLLSKVIYQFVFRFRE